MKKIFLALLIFCVWVSVASGGMVIQKISGAAGGTLLVGINTTYSNSFLGATDEMHWYKNGYVASASGDIAKGYFYLDRPHSATALKLCVYDSSKNLLYSIVNDGSLAQDTWIEFTFSSGSITSGNTYYLGIVANEYWYSYHEGTSGDCGRDSTGTYANPPDPIGTGTIGYGAIGGIYLED